MSTRACCAFLILSHPWMTRRTTSSEDENLDGRRRTTAVFAREGRTAISAFGGGASLPCSDCDSLLCFPFSSNLLLLTSSTSSAFSRHLDESMRASLNSALSFPTESNEASTSLFALFLHAAYFEPRRHSYFDCCRRSRHLH